jgi:hypothetical protein
MLKTAFLVFAVTIAFGYTLKTGNCVTHEQRLKNQRESIERTARLLTELEQKIKEIRERNLPSHHPNPQSKKTRVGIREEKNGEEEEKS